MTLPPTRISSPVSMLIQRPGAANAHPLENDAAHAALVYTDTRKWVDAVMRRKRVSLEQVSHPVLSNS